MLSSNEAKYQRLGTTNPLHDTDSFSVRVLYKDKSHSLNDLNGQTTVGTFKGLIENVTDCPAQRQRLICAGKQLKPDEKTLSFFKITDGITIHLFPLPEVMPQAQPNTESTASAIPNSFSIEHTPFSNHTPAHLDPYIERTSLEVRWWSTLLLFLSAFSVFNYSSTLYSTGELGEGVFESMVNFLDLCCSVMGVYVGTLGNNSVRTLNLEDLNKYVKNLTMLAILCVAFRILWVFEVFLVCKKLVKDSHTHAEDTDGSIGNGGGGTGDTTDINDPIDPKYVSQTTIQASFICMICVLAWLSCLTRAVRLRNAVRTTSGQDRNNTPPVVNLPV